MKLPARVFRWGWVSCSITRLVATRYTDRSNSAAGEASTGSTRRRPPWLGQCRWSDDHRLVDEHGDVVAAPGHACRSSRESPGPWEALVFPLYLQPGELRALRMVAVPDASPAAAPLLADPGRLEVPGVARVTDGEIAVVGLVLPAPSLCLISDRSEHEFRFRFYGGAIGPDGLDATAKMLQRPPAMADVTSGMPAAE